MNEVKQPSNDLCGNSTWTFKDSLGMLKLNAESKTTCPAFTSTIYKFNKVDSLVTHDQ